MTQYEIGETKRIQCTFVNAAGAVSDPATIQLRIGVLLDDGSVDTLQTYTYAAAQLTKNGTGVYYRDYTFDRAGRHIAEFTTTGTPTTTVVTGKNGELDVATPLTWVA